MISVIIPTFNRSELLFQALRSVFLQTYQNIEVIVVDDGSTDDTKNVVSIFPKVKYIFQENQNISAARNKGIDLALGKYIAFLDSDDLWAPTHLEKSLDLMDRDKNVGLVGGAHAYFNPNGTIIKTNVECPCPHGHLFKDMFLKNTPFQTSTAVLRKSLIDKYGNFKTEIGCFKGGCIGEDYEFFCRIAKHTKIAYVKDILVFYRTHDSNITDQNGIFIISSGKKYLAKQYPELLPLLPQAESEALARAGFLSIKNRKKLLAIIYFIISIIKSPLSNPMGIFYAYQGLVKAILPYGIHKLMKQMLKPSSKTLLFDQKEWNKLWIEVSKNRFQTKNIIIQK